MRALATLRRAQQAVARSLAVFVKDVGHGLLEVGHNTLAVVGLAVVAVAVFTAGRADLREQAEALAYEWLQTRHEERAQANGDVLVAVAEPEAIARATAADPAALTNQQAAVTRWIARRYKVAQEPIGALVQEAWAMGQRAGLDPTLILAVMAVESSFNPFAQSPVGAQGLMQVMTRVHDDKYEAFGGVHAAFDPVSNLRVGVKVLQECIARAGSLEGGLRFYVGAGNMADDGGYAAKVMAEHFRLRQVAGGRAVPFNPPPSLSTQAPVQSIPAAAPRTPAPAAVSDEVALLTPGL